VPPDKLKTSTVKSPPKAAKLQAENKKLQAENKKLQAKVIAHRSEAIILRSEIEKLKKLLDEATRGRISKPGVIFGGPR